MVLMNGTIGRLRGVTICCIVLVCVAASCILPRKELLPERVRSYHQAYKWKEYSIAARYVDDPVDFIEKSKAISENYEIVDLEIKSITINPEGFEAEVEVVRVYHIYPSVVVKRKRVVQQWKYDKKKKNWFLISPY